MDRAGDRRHQRNVCRYGGGETVGFKQFVGQPNVNGYCFNIVTLGELVAANSAELQTGPFGTQLHASSYVRQGVPVVAVKNIGDNVLVTDDIPMITDVDAVRLSRYRLIENDILFSRKGAVERRALIRAREQGWIQGSDCIRLRFDGTVDAKYVSYFLGSAQAQQWLTQHAHGATMPSLNQAILGLLPIPLPPLAEQRAIAHILGTLDDKIEINRQMNATLDEIARTLFTSWFVNFDPVRAKIEGRQPDGMDAETAALFPDRLVESDLGPIPEGWAWQRLGDIAVNVRDGVSAAEIHADLNYIGLEHMPKRSIALSDWESADRVTSNKSRFRHDDVLFGKLRPYFHKVGLAPVDGICSTDILVVRPKECGCLAWVLAVVSSDAMVDHAVARSSGPRMPRASWADLSDFIIAVPKAPVVNAFERQIRPMLELLNQNVHQSRTLAELRDTLLPELLAGRVQAPGFEPLVKEMG